MYKKLNAREHIMMVYTSQISKKEVDWINEKKVIERIKFKFCLKSAHV